ncbi:sugar phosphate isomerase/epimerase family protein [Gehongia tenuis]|uniref:Sugar phosphate isomerase/epimerase n=1 Tax=Gehongia tenuis TaxID=2763655 RepID=A0A926HPG9_9FIRM|nr:sugar phosphate isomerase/epimerase [Gehongia tenuis]MBC8530690.1 sugar phosphate isomerase/epimerase [Gehongia tenuis]
MKVGLQIYSVRNHMNEDPLGTLKKVSDMGYKYIESYSHPEGKDVKTFGFGMDAKDAKAVLDDLGLKVVGAHFYPLIPEGLDEFCEYYAELGVPQVGCGGTWELDIETKAPYLNEAGRIAKKHGIRYYYHNHVQEYREVDGEYIQHRFYNETDPELVYFELDTFWVARSGIDPRDEMEFFKDRLVLLHQKDFAKDAGEPLVIFEKLDRQTPMSGEVYGQNKRVEAFAEVGTGILPIQDYIDKANEIGVPYILLEQDLTKMDEIDSIETSMNAFKKFKGIEWD